MQADHQDTHYGFLSPNLRLGRAVINEERGAKSHPNPRKPTKAHQSAVKSTKAG